ncbi:MULTISPECIES: DUF4870 family protein [Methylocaldum]|jgi:uncharacterized membrane protein|uniref:DUF4870 family protein n=1 Tax=unclassified Methylocaldum TaxID=2622260 RepID=UPI0010E9D395|nr:MULTISPECIES: hypothetical protein [unclassified Methylocaldum]MBP1152443.1 putative membrane protein [Methylocaldum sp. RMAD-M]MDV3242360.1 hypothetical protein [Methylocaldum sp.]
MQGKMFPESDARDLSKEKRLTQVIYALQAASFLVGITYIVAAVINYVKWPDVAGTWLETHFRWQIRTFWYGILWGIVGGLTLFAFVGYVILTANTIWIVYRIAVGWMALSEDRPVS